MRKGVRTLRGTLAPNEIRQLVVDDGIFTNGLRITYFSVWQSELIAGLIAIGCLSTNDFIINTDPLPANDPAVFAWSAMSTGNITDVQLATFDRLDPDHVINEELFIHNRVGTSLEYLIIAEPYTMSEDEGVLQLVKNKQQSV